MMNKASMTKTVWLGLNAVFLFDESYMKSWHMCRIAVAEYIAKVVSAVLKQVHAYIESIDSVG